MEDLLVWQKARILCKEIHLLIKAGAFSADQKLLDQINRSSSSIMDNLAEGFGRQGLGEFLNYIRIALGSAVEVKSQLYRSIDRNYISSERFTHLLGLTEEIIKMSYGLKKKIIENSAERKSN
ncbi:MAG: four helix bundle protein [Gemmatimonadaceae bacterium]|nr:four helix bundle protein [Chitinophagaceae bacterium]